MRSFLWISFGVLIVVGAVVAVQVTAPPPVGAALTRGDTIDKTAIGAIVREYIIANPEVLVEAMQELERKQDSQRESTAKNAIRAYEGELLRDGDSPVGGNPDGDVTLVEFNDYQCPYCKRAFTTIEAETKADGRVKIIYKDLPILGDASRIAAYAALAAQKQGKHAGFHKALMEFKGKLDRTRILEIAASVGIDVPQLEKDMEEPRIRQVVERNLALAGALGVRGTPAFVIGGEFVPGAIDADALKRLIAEARKKPGSPGR